MVRIHAGEAPVCSFETAADRESTDHLQNGRKAVLSLRNRESRMPHRTNLEDSATALRRGTLSGVINVFDGGAIHSSVPHLRQTTSTRVADGV